MTDTTLRCTCDFGAMSVLLDDLPDDVNPHRPECPLAKNDVDVAGWEEGYEALRAAEHKATYCKACGGEGWLPSLPEGESTCPACKGTGKDKPFKKRAKPKYG